MTEFEMQRKLRAMNAPREPDRDLWPAIAARIAAPSETSAQHATRRRWIPLAAAASTVLAIAGGTNVFPRTSQTQRLSPQTCQRWGQKLSPRSCELRHCPQ